MVRIGELAELVGISTRAIRHYHRIGVLPEPAREANGYRSYGLRDAVLLLRVRRLTELGMSLDEAAEAITDDAGHDSREILSELDADLAEQQRQLQQRRNRIRELLTDEADPRRSTDSADVLRELTHVFGDDHPGVERERMILEAMAHAAGPHEGELLQMYRQSLADPELTRRTMEAMRRFEQLADAAADDPRVAELGIRIAEDAATMGLRPRASQWERPAEITRWLRLVTDDLTPAQAECMRVCFARLRDLSC